MTEYGRTPKYWTDLELDDLAIQAIGLGGGKAETVLHRMEENASRLQMLVLSQAIQRVGQRDEDGLVTLKPEIRKRLEAEQQAKEKSSRA